MSCLDPRDDIGVVKSDDSATIISDEAPLSQEQQKEALRSQLQDAMQRLAEVKLAAERAEAEFRKQQQGPDVDPNSKDDKWCVIQ